MPQPIYTPSLATIGLTSPVPANGQVVSNLMTTGGPTTGAWQSGGVGVVLAQTGTLTVQRYLDTAGLLPIGAALTVALVAAVGNTVGWSDNLPYRSMKVTVANSSGSSAALSSVAVVLQSV